MKSSAVALFAVAALVFAAFYLRSTLPGSTENHGAQGLSAPRGSSTAERKIDLVLRLSQVNSQTDLRAEPFFANSIISINVNVVNDLGAAVSLLDITRSCFCTSVTADFKRLEAGASGNLSLLLQTHNEEGEFSSDVGVTYKEAGKDASPTAQVGFQYKSAMVLKSEVSNLWLKTSQNQRGTVAQASVKRGSMPLRFSDLAAKSSNALFSARVEKNDGDSWTLILEQVANVPAGAIWGEIVVFPQGSAPEQGSLKISVGGSCKGPYSPIPATVFWGETVPGAAHAEPIVIDGDFSVPTELLACEVVRSPDGLIVSVSEVARVDDRKARFLLECKPVRVGVWKDVVSLSVTHGGKRSDIAVFVRGTAAKPAPNPAPNPK